MWGGGHWEIPPPPLVPLDAGPGHQAQHSPLDYVLLDQVDEGVQRLAVAPLTPRTQRIRDLEAMVEDQNNKYHSTINEAQGLIDRANKEARALQREDGAGWYDARAQPPGPPASLSEMPTLFEFGSFHSGPPMSRATPIVPLPHHPPPPFPTHGVWLYGGGSHLRPRF